MHMVVRETGFTAKTERESRISNYETVEVIHIIVSPQTNDCGDIN